MLEETHSQEQACETVIDLEDVIKTSLEYWKVCKKTQDFQKFIFPEENPISTRKQSYLKRQIIKVFFKSYKGLKLTAREKGNYSLRNLLLKLLEHKLFEKIKEDMLNMEDYLQRMLGKISKDDFPRLTKIHKFISVCFIFQIKDKIEKHEVNPEALVTEIEKRRKKKVKNLQESKSTEKNIQVKEESQKVKDQKIFEEESDEENDEEREDFYSWIMKK